MPVSQRLGEAKLEDLLADTQTIRAIEEGSFIDRLQLRLLR